MKKIMKKKDGVSSIELVISIMIFLMVLCFFLDITMLTWKFTSLSSVNTNVTRAVSLQGGVKNTVPSGYPGGNTEYLTSSELYDLVENVLNGAGVEDYEFDVYINNIKLTSNSNIQVDYLQPINVKITTRYDWVYISNFIPGNLSHTVSSERNSLSEFKYNYDSWSGE